MIRITVECEGVKSTVEQQDAVTLTEAVELFEGALRGIFVSGRIGL